MFAKSTYFSICLFVIGLVFSGCHYSFNNPVDPESDEYIGYEVIPGVNKTLPISIRSDGAITFPVLEWTSCSDISTYALQVGSSAGFFPYTIQLDETYFDKNNNGLIQYSSGSAWPTGNDYEELWALPAGKYFWRVNVSNSRTGNLWGDWSSASFFELKVRMKEMYWSFDEEDENAVKQGYRYYFDQAGKAEKEIQYIHFLSEEEPRWIESIVTTFNEEGKPDRETVYTDLDCTPDSKLKSFQYLYVKDDQDRLIKREKRITYDDEIEYAGESSLFHEEERFFYDEHLTDQIIRVEKRKYDSQLEVWWLYYRSEYEEGKQFQTTFYGRDKDNDNKLYINYFYTLYYDTEYADKPVLAKYYMRNRATGEMEYYNDYILQYNFPDPDSSGIIINLQSEEKGIHPAHAEESGSRVSFSQPIDSDYLFN